MIKVEFSTSIEEKKLILFDTENRPILEFRIPASTAATFQGALPASAVISKIRITGSEKFNADFIIGDMKGWSMSFSVDSGEQLALAAEVGTVFEGTIEHNGGTYSGKLRGSREPVGFIVHQGPIRIQSESLNSLKKILLRPKDKWPLVDLGVILTAYSHTDSFQDGFLLYRWQFLPKTYVFLFENRRIQSRFMKRLAFYIEKAGSVGTLRSNEYFQNKRGYNAHDYPAEDLARFFTEARKLQFQLNPEEYKLLDILLDSGILKREDNQFKPGEGVILSVSMDSWIYLRNILLNHEATHALFFLNQTYREEIKNRWENLNENLKAFWRAYLSNESYDTSNDVLMANEYQAYLQQRTIQEAGWAFGSRIVNRLRRTHPSQNQLWNSLGQDGGAVFLKEAKEVQSIMQKYLHGEAGRLNLWEPHY